MRQVFVQVPTGDAARALDIAQRCRAVFISRMESRDDAGTPVALLMLHVDNARLGPFVDEASAIERLHLSLIPSGAVVLRPPPGDVPDQVGDVSARSPLEIYLAGLQAIGSWKGFLGYAAAAGGVVWLGLTTNTVVLLVGAMLIAPFAEPAMTAALATASGDWTLLWRSLLRYVAALVASAAVAAALTALLGPEHPTREMVNVANVSIAAMLLPLVAGGAGALHLVQGDRSSLVSGAAAGILIAASLAPPIGLLGIAPVVGDPSLMHPAIFLVLLQLVGINLSAALVFRAFGLRSSGARFRRGRPLVTVLALAVTILAGSALLLRQVASPGPALRRATIAEEATGTALGTLGADPDVDVVDASARFTRRGPADRHTLLVTAHVVRRTTAVGGDSTLGARLTEAVRNSVAQQHPEATVLAHVQVLHPSPRASRAP